jgi:hypothetical protein
VRREQFRAASLIQARARLKLYHIRIRKNRAASSIQRAWRRRVFIWIALLRCIYRCPITELHAAATVIQTRWRAWHLYKNNPIASKYRQTLDVIQRAVNRIGAWWQPRGVRLAWRRENERVGDFCGAVRGR